MKHTLLALCASLAIITTAHADSETIKLNGKTGDSIRAELMQAANRVCEIPTIGLGREYDAECASRSYIKALFKAKRAAPEAFTLAPVQHEQIAERQ